MSQDRKKFPAAIPNPTAMLQRAPSPAQGAQAAQAVQMPREPDPAPHLTLVPTPSPDAPVGRSTVMNARMPEMGILESYMRDPDVTEIMVNDIRNIMIEKDGKIQPTRFNFKSVDELNRFVTRMMHGTGKMLTPDLPYADFMLPDGSRVNVVGPPLTTGGPCVTIRKFPSRRFGIQDLLAQGTLDQAMSYFLNACVLGRRNILISGGTSSGKTTLLNVLTQFVPKNDRIVLIEETPELSISHINSVCLQTKAATLTSAAVTPRELVTHALRMRPDRIIMGECHKAETFEMIQAMSGGHVGSMTTLHANSCRNALARLETLCMLSGAEIPLIPLRRQISGAIDVIVQVQRLKNGKRRVAAISQVTGLEGEAVGLHDIFVCDDEKGKFRATGYAPTFIDSLKEQGIEVPRSIFGG